MTIKRLEIANPAYSPAHTQTLTIHSSHLNRRHDVSIYNADAQGENVPIIILMHGVYGNHWVWMQLGGVHQVYQKLKDEQGLGEFILVMPSDGGLFDGSAYLPTKHYGNYDAWIMEDVITGVIETVSGASAQSALYLTGLSMGGYGALRLGIKYANKVKAISAHSSITQLTDMQEFVDTNLSLYECENPQESNILYWLEKNQANLPPLRFDCGEDDVLYSSNVQFSQALKQQSIPHQFDTFSGEHSWSYWHEHIEKTFWFFNNIEKQTTQK